MLVGNFASAPTCTTLRSLCDADARERGLSLQSSFIRTLLRWVALASVEVNVPAEGCKLLEGCRAGMHLLSTMCVWHCRSQTFHSSASACHLAAFMRQLQLLQLLQLHRRSPRVSGRFRAANEVVNSRWISSTRRRNKTSVCALTAAH